MLVRVLQFLVGALLGAGGGYLAWMNRGDLGGLFPPGPAGPPWLLVLGILGLAAGVVFLVSAVVPRPNRRRETEAREAKRAEQLGEAEAYYSEAGRAADRDWRSGDIPAPAAPRPVQAPAAEQPAPQAVVSPAPQPQPVTATTAKPVATSAPPAAQEPAAPPSAPIFPSTAPLSPIPAATEAPPPVVSAPPVEAVADDPHGAIRAAIKEGRLQEAEQLLEAGKETAQGLVLAELTGLAGDHAAASGRQSHAKWLWRLAIKRFGEEGAMDSAAAKAVAERLRTAS